MTLRQAALGAFLLALPVGIDVPASRDSTGWPGRGTRLEIAGGTGYYALISRDCEGVPYAHQPLHYRDGGASIAHHLRGPLALGLRGGLLHDEIGGDGSLDLPANSVRTNAYVNPYLAIEGHRAGIGGGWMWADKPFIFSGPDVVHNVFSAHLRIGDPAHRYLSTSWMENVPLYSGGGYFDFGLGFHAGSRVDAWAGFSAGGPFDGTGAALKADWWVMPRASLDLRARLGSAGSQAQSGVSLGLGYRLGGP